MDGEDAKCNHKQEKEPYESPATIINRSTLVLNATMYMQVTKALQLVVHPLL